MESLDRLLSKQLQVLPLTNAAYFASRTRLIKEMTQVMDAAKDWHGVVIQPSHDGLQFIARNAAFGFLRWNGRLDVRLSAELRDRLIAEEMAARDSSRAKSDRVVWIVRSSADVDRAIWLLRLSYLRWCRDLDLSA